nr:N-acetylglucosamine-6-phosphate deacetylase [Palleronia pontilimi]
MLAHIASAVHDGTRLHQDAALIVEDGVCAGIVAAADIPKGALRVVSDGIICPGFVDLQVNGGGGLMFNERPDPDGLRQIARAHARLGTSAFLPTLITDTPQKTRAAVAAVRSLIAAGDTIVAGLHLEGPHLSVARKGAHDPTLVRQMELEDLTYLCEASGTLPALMVTLAPENVTNEQIATLSGAGVIVSLGHTDADYETCMTAFRAGARGVTHLFNAMSPLGHRAPGLVGAALDAPGVMMGLIADGIHVHPAAMRAALAARGDGLFLVSDAMAIAGTDLKSFALNGRIVTRSNGRLALPDGTLAGADLIMPDAIATCIRDLALTSEQAIVMATSRPAELMGFATAGRLVVGAPLRAVVLRHDLGFATVLDDVSREGSPD